MNYTKRQIDLAGKIMCSLLKNKVIREEEDRELFNIYKSDYYVKEILEIMESSFDVYIISSNEEIYLVPHDDNSFLGFKNQDYKDIVFKGFPQEYKINDYVGLAHFIELQIINIFYSSDKDFIREFIDLNELENIVAEELKFAKENSIKNGDSEENIEIYERFYNIYNSFGNYDGELTTTKTEKRTREGFIKGIVNFYCEQDLLSYIDEETNRIQPTSRFNEIMNKIILSEKYKEENVKLGEIIE